jgi:hypothetical protein
MRAETSVKVPNENVPDEAAKGPSRAQVVDRVASCRGFLSVGYGTA